MTELPKVPTIAEFSLSANPDYDGPYLWVEKSDYDALRAAAEQVVRERDELRESFALFRKESSTLTYDYLKLSSECSGLRAELAAERKRAEDAQGQWSVGFKRGQESILRKNDSGCCCKIDEAGETILSACDCHKDWANKRAEDARAAAVEDVVDVCLNRIAHINSNADNLAAFGDSSAVEARARRLGAMYLNEMVEEIRALATVPSGHVVVPVDLLDALCSEEGAEQHHLDAARLLLTAARKP